MSKRTLVALIIGWLLGIGTAFAIPTLVYQRQSIIPGPDASLRDLLNNGWYVTREDGAIWTLERPRFRIP